MHRVWRLVRSAALLLCAAACHGTTMPLEDGGTPSALDAGGNEPGRSDAQSLLPAVDASRDARAHDALIEGTPDAGLGYGRSRGCGTKQVGTGSFDAFATLADGINRTCYFNAPKSYDPAHAYAVIFRFHGYGGTGNSGGLEIEQVSKDEALIIAPVGLLESDGKNLSWNPKNQDLDLAYFDRLLVWVAENYCVDLDRVFAYGFSAGGGMAQLLACERADALRAVGTIAAVNRVAGLSCQGKTAGFLRYDQNDPAVPLSEGTAVRDHLLLQNGCSTASEPMGSECVRYTACSKGEPVVWCVTSQPSELAHDPGGASAATPIWTFFSGLPSTLPVVM